MDRSEMMNHFIETILNKIEKKKAVDTNKLTIDEKIKAAEEAKKTPDKKKK